MTTGGMSSGLLIHMTKEKEPRGLLCRMIIIWWSMTRMMKLFGPAILMDKVQVRLNLSYMIVGSWQSLMKKAVNSGALKLLFKTMRTQKDLTTLTENVLTTGSTKASI